MVQTLKLGGNKRNEQLRNAIKAQISIFVERVHGAEAFGAGQSRTSSKGRRGKVADFNEGESWAHYQGPQCAPVPMVTLENGSKKK